MGLNSQRICCRGIYVVVQLLVINFVFTNSVLADANGRIGYSGLSGFTCTDCHDPITNVPMVTLTGPAATTVAPGSVSSFTFLMSGGPGTASAGLNIAANGGTLMDTSAAGTQMSAGEITHTSPLMMPGGSITWTFDWQAPATAGTYTIYAVGLSGNDDGNDGPGDGTANATFQLTVTGQTTPQDPVALITGPSTGTAGTSIAFSGMGSSDADGTIVSYMWDFGDNTAGSGATVNHTYVAGVYTVMLTVTDDSGATNAATMNIIITDVGAAQPPIADVAGPYMANVGEMIAFDGSASMDPDGTIMTYDWSFGDGGVATGMNPGYAYSIAGTFIVTLAVTDNDGMVGTISTSAVIADVMTPGPAPTPGMGESLYDTHCMECHGPGGSGGSGGEVVGEDAEDIIEAIMEEPTMNYLSNVLRRSEIDMIAHFLEMMDEEDDEVDGDDDDEIIISAGETLYDTFCGSCHGLNGSGGQASAVIGATVEDIDNAVANEATMAVQVSVLSRDFLTKIVEYLDQNESSSNDSNSGGGGAIYWLWLLFPAYWLLRRRK